MPWLADILAEMMAKKLSARNHRQVALLWRHVNRNEQCQRGLHHEVRYRGESIPGIDCGDLAGQRMIDKLPGSIRITAIPVDALLVTAIRTYQKIRAVTGAARGGRRRLDYGRPHALAAGVVDSISIIGIGRETGRIGVDPAIAGGGNIILCPGQAVQCIDDAYLVNAGFEGPCDLSNQCLVRFIRYSRKAWNGKRGMETAASSAMTTRTATSSIRENSLLL